MISSSKITAIFINAFFLEIRHRANMKNYDNYNTVRDEMKMIGVEPQYFDTFFDKLKKSYEIPSQKEVNEALPKDFKALPKEHYDKIIDYLKSNRVLRDDEEVLEDGLKSLDNRLEREYRQRAAGLLKKAREIGERKPGWHMKDGRFRPGSF